MFNVFRNRETSHNHVRTDFISAEKSPCFQEFREDMAFPLAVRGPVDARHGQLRRARSEAAAR